MKTKFVIENRTGLKPRTLVRFSIPSTRHKGEWCKTTGFSPRKHHERRVEVIFAITLLLLLALPSLSLAKTYPNSCPAEARGVLEVVGGCSAVDCEKFPAICEKCCPKPKKLSLGLVLLVVLAVLGFIVWRLPKAKRAELIKKVNEKVKALKHLLRLKKT